MTCRECEKQIPDFIGKKMHYLEMKRFLEHVDSCGSCRGAPAGSGWKQGRIRR